MHESTQRGWTNKTLRVACRCASQLAFDSSLLFLHARNVESHGSIETRAPILERTQNTITATITIVIICTLFVQRLVSFECVIMVVGFWIVFFFALLLCHVKELCRPKILLIRRVSSAVCGTLWRIQRLGYRMQDLSVCTCSILLARAKGPQGCDRWVRAARRALVEAGLVSIQTRSTAK